MPPTVLLAFTGLASAQEPDPAAYRDPPANIVDVLDARRPPVVSISPDDRWMLELDSPDLPPLSELAEPRVKIAGFQVNPRTHGPAGASGYTGITLRELGRADKVRRIAVDVGPTPRIGNVDWSFDSRHVAFTNTTPDGIELWVAGIDGAARRLLGPTLNAAYGAPCDWLPGDAGLLCKVVPADFGPAPERGLVPTGPRVEQNLGRAAPARTYTNLLRDAHDVALFEHYLTSEVVAVGLDGSTRRVLPAGLIDELTPSPDGAWLLVERLVPPWSTTVPASRFPMQIDAMRLQDGTTVRVADLPLADDVPIPFGSVRTGRRSVDWRADEPATLWFVEALDGGDAGAEAELRDALSVWSAPFDAAPRRVWQGGYRFAGVQWGDADFALVSESWYKTRQLRVWQIDPRVADGAPTLHWERSTQDRYADPGSPITTTGPYGWGVLRVDDGALLLRGSGWSESGMHPFLDRYDLTKRTSQRLWQSADPWLESVVAVLDDPRPLLREGPARDRPTVAVGAARSNHVEFVTSRQSPDHPPNYHLRKVGRKEPVAALTDFADWAPAFAGVEKQVVRYTRADGLPLTANLYLPPGWKPSDGPLPTVFWAYPSEFKHRADAGQVTKTDAGFSRPGGASHLFFLMHGYAVVDDPSIPILGEGDAEPNDTFIPQLVDGAKAAVDTFVARGVTDPERTIIGGHSYGAFMTAHLLAHTDLFRAGIARSGAYNRSLTPFGFQGEERTYWQATETYTELSPFTHAPKIDEPLLMLHGADDSNAGTYPIQSARLYDALRGLGGTVRWVELPYEDHGYRARESVGHALWEMLTWADTHTAGPRPPKPQGAESR